MPDIFNILCTKILANPSSSPIIVAIDGVDGSSKSRFAKSLALELAQRNRHILQTSVDFFHNQESVRKPLNKPLPKSFFEDSYNYPALSEKLLDPIKHNSCSSVYLKHFDHRADSKIDESPVAVREDTILVFDGIFLHRDELRPYWDFSIFLDVSFKETYKRMAVRDGYPEDYLDERNARYYQGQLIYLEKCKPKSKATVVIDNNDFHAPIVVKP